MIKSDGITNQYSFNANLIYEKKYWGGVTYRVSDAMIFMAGVQLPMNLTIGLAYDYPIGGMHSYSSGSFEIMLKYCFKVTSNKGPSRNKSVRFL